MDLIENAFSARNGENFEKRCFQPTIKQHTVFKKEYSMNGFAAKPTFQRKIAAKRCF